MFDKLLIQDNVIRLSDPLPVQNQQSVEPALCLTDDGGVVIWSQQSLTGDQICVRRFNDSGFGHVQTWSEDIGVECQPAVTTLPDGRILGVHVARRDAEWHIISRLMTDQSLSPEHVVDTNTDGMFNPTLLTTSDDTWLVYERADGARSNLMVTKFDGNKWDTARMLNLSFDVCRRPRLAEGFGGVWCAFDAYHNGVYGVFLHRLDAQQPTVTVVQGNFQSLQPAITQTRDGALWVGYASNHNVARRDPWWMAKWSELRRFDGETVQMPTPQPERDVYKDDSFQGWEFPATFADTTGGVWIVGQSAHTLYMAGCGADGWTTFYNIAPKHWGTWKPRTQVAGDGSTFYLLTMGLSGAQLQRLDIVEPLGAPPLFPTRSTSVVNYAKARLLDDRPTLETPDGDNLNYYFGDLHAHSVYGDAVGDVDEFYHRYRDAYGYDFATLTEHDYLDNLQLGASELRMMWNIARRISNDGEFIAMYGYEWTSPAIAEHADPDSRVGEGHRHVIYPDDSGPLVSYGDAANRTGAALLERLHGQRALVIPHHTSWAGTDWDAHDPELQRVVEVVSTHGRFEHSGNRPIGYRRDHIHPHKFVQDALDRGYKLGLVGGSDSHGLLWHATETENRDSHIEAGTRIGWKEDSYRTGMTVVLAPELTRESIFQALYDRRCYATSGVPIVLDFRINDHLMGSEIEVHKPPTLNIRVQGTSALHSVEVLRSGQVIAGVNTQAGEELMNIAFDFVDKLLIPGEHHYYYLRVTQEDDNMAWSSPIWIHFLEKPNA